MNFLYYVPGEQREMLTADLLPPPLDFTLAGRPFHRGQAALTCIHLHSGPDRAAGLLFNPVPTANGGVEPATLYLPERQLWEDHGAFWLGWDRERRATPADLQRTGPPIEGRPMTLADGNEWAVPVVGPHYSKLPHVFKRMEGRSRLVIADRYRALAAESERWAVWLASDDTAAWVDVMEFVARCLGLNYHLGLEEVGALDLLDTTNAKDVLSVICGLTDYLEELDAKKAE